MIFTLLYRRITAMSITRHKNDGSVEPQFRPSKKSRWDFFDEHPHCPHSLTAKPSVRTVVRIEVFFAPAELGQKKISKTRFAGKNHFFDKLKRRLC